MSKASLESSHSGRKGEGHLWTGAVRHVLKAGGKGQDCREQKRPEVRCGEKSEVAIIIIQKQKVK